LSGLLHILLKFGDGWGVPVGTFQLPVDFTYSSMVFFQQLLVFVMIVADARASPCTNVLNRMCTHKMAPGGGKGGSFHNFCMECSKVGEGPGWFKYVRAYN
jgi:hypothetical protein